MNTKKRLVIMDNVYKYRAMTRDIQDINQAVTNLWHLSLADGERGSEYFYADVKPITDYTMKLLEWKESIWKDMTGEQKFSADPNKWEQGR